MKKSLKEFLEKVIIPIEERKIDNGKLYVSLKAWWGPWQKSIDIEYIDGIQKDYWKIEDGIFPGGWVTHNKSEYHTYGLGSLNLGLKTLSLLLFSNDLEETLFEAEYEGPRTPLRCDQVYSYGLTIEDINKKMPKFLEHAFDCLPMGVNTEKARLQKRVLKWDPFTGWKFGLTCMKRALKEAEYDAKSGEYKYELPGIYYEAINLGEAHMKYFQNNFKDTNYETLKSKYKMDSGDLGPDKLFSPEYFVMNEINSWVKKNYSTMHNFLASGLDKVLTGVQPWKAAEYASAQISIFKIRQFDKKYNIPSLMEDSETLRRIDYAFMKEEMDWQVQYLIDILDE